MTAEMPVILLTGATGQIGADLVVALAPLGRVVAPARAQFDLADPPSLRAAIRDLQPDVVVNAAAYTAVDLAESDVQRCMTTNAEAPGVLAEEAARLGAMMVHYSTDYVFDGSNGVPYHEDDEPSPLNIYGRSKLAGERRVAAAGGRHLILRTSWVYGAHGRNFLRTIQRLVRERDEVRVVCDQTGSPTWSKTIAETTAMLVARWRDEDTSTSGVYHLTAAGSTTWYEFANAILEDDPAWRGMPHGHIVPIASNDYPSVARRPGYSVLDNTKIGQRFGVAIPDWRVELRSMLGAFPN
jgi:dTDP-4-dehydrorhamnose reductase